MLVLLGIGFLAGVVTAISPCVLPVLPILLAGGASGRKPFRIIAGLVTSFVVFTLFATWLLSELGLPADFLRNLAIALLFLVAATLIVPRLALLIEKPFARLTRFRAGGGGFLLGASLGLVFVPCAGPVLAAISVVAANNNVGLRAILLTIAYALGAAVPMALIALGGKRLAGRLRTQRPAAPARLGDRDRRSSRSRSRFNADTRFQTALPGYTQALQKHIEDSSDRPAPARQADRREARPTALPGPGRHERRRRPAELRRRAGARARRPLVQLAAADARGAARQGRADRLLDVLVHQLPAHAAAPEGAGTPPTTATGSRSSASTRPSSPSSTSPRTWQAAIKRLGITYPVVQDNDFAHLERLLEPVLAGRVPDRPRAARSGTTEVGEGGYAETESAIQALLGRATSTRDRRPTRARPAPSHPSPTSASSGST